MANDQITKRFITNNLTDSDSDSDVLLIISSAICQCN